MLYFLFFEAFLRAFFKEEIVFLNVLVKTSGEFTGAFYLEPRPPPLG